MSCGTSWRTCRRRTTEQRSSRKPPASTATALSTRSTKWRSSCTWPAHAQWGVCCQLGAVSPVCLCMWVLAGTAAREKLQSPCRYEARVAVPEGKCARVSKPLHQAHAATLTYTLQPVTFLLPVWSYQSLARRLPRHKIETLEANVIRHAEATMGMATTVVPPPPRRTTSAKQVRFGAASSSAGARTKGARPGATARLIKARSRRARPT